MGEFPFNIQDMFAQVQKFQEQMARVRADLETQTVEASSGGGMVSVTINGALNVTALKIDPSVIDPSDPAMLQDLIRVAVNEGLRKAKEMMEQSLKGMTGGLNVPGLRDLFGM